MSSLLVTSVAVWPHACVRHQRILAHARIRGDKNIGFVTWCLGLPQHRASHLAGWNKKYCGLAKQTGRDLPEMSRSMIVEAKPRCRPWLPHVPNIGRALY